MGRWSWMGLAMMLFAFAAVAAGPGAVRKQIEMSMRVTGTVAVDSNGKIFEHGIDKREELPPGVVRFIEEAMEQWEFAPPLVDGQSVNVRNKMSILVVAKKLDNGDYLMRMQAVSFDPLQNEEGYEVAKKKMSPPRYPVSAAKAGASGTVYLVLKVGSDGKVQEAVAEQVNLKIIGSENQMNQLRRLFADASLAAARRWEFVPPSKGELAAADHWTMRIPVDYSMGMQFPKYGQWVAYVPGPKQQANWLDENAANSSPEAMEAGEPRLVGHEPLQLLTPLRQEG